MGDRLGNMLDAIFDQNFLNLRIGIRIRKLLVMLYNYRPKIASVFGPFQ